MAFFNSQEPFFRKKQEELDFQDRCGSLSLNYRLLGFNLSLGTYTRVDQVFLVWGVLCGIIFATAQFSTISWQTQAIVWSIATIIGAVVMVLLTNFWVKVERLAWVLYFWVGLVMIGIAITDLGIFQCWGSIMGNLCPIWLGLTGIGYLFTGIGTRSRSLIVAGFVHWLGIGILLYITALPFLATGIIMGLTCLVFAQVQWDMRSPIEYAMLSFEQKQFNRLQHQLRQTVSLSEG
jgi:hypothetical protein